MAGECHQHLAELPKKSQVGRDRWGRPLEHILQEQQRVWELCGELEWAWAAICKMTFP